MITCPIQNHQYRCSSVVINHADLTCCHYRKLHRLIVFVESFRMVLFAPLEPCVGSITLKGMVLLSMEYKVKMNLISFTFLLLLWFVWECISLNQYFADRIILYYVEQLKSSSEFSRWVCCVDTNHWLSFYWILSSSVVKWYSLTTCTDYASTVNIKLLNRLRASVLFSAGWRRGTVASVKFSRWVLSFRSQSLLAQGIVP